MWVLISFLAVSLRGVWLDIATSIRWVDHIDKNDMDTFFDRAVIITMTNDGNETGLAPGVLINNETVLTSFNPFRSHIKDKGSRTKVIISVLHERHITDWTTVNYTLKNYTIVCARQVIPVPDDEDYWMDDKKEQSPLHDLMVIRLNESVALISPDPNLYSFDQYGRWGTSSVIAGPMVTFLAEPSADMYRSMKFASLGFINHGHISKSFHLRSHEFEAEDNVLTPCEGWLPREWGMFFCVRNVMEFKALGSGALLIHNNLLIGVGSFKLRKGKDSILVFTDVRDYYQLINETCSIEDQLLEFRTTTTSTTSTTTPVPAFR